MPADSPQSTTLEVLARAIDSSGFDRLADFEPWAAQRRQSSYDKARKYLAALKAAGWIVCEPGHVPMPRTLNEARAMNVLSQQFIEGEAYRAARQR